MATRYWVASLPVGQGGSASSLWSRLQESISKQAFDTSLYRVLFDSLYVSLFVVDLFSNCVWCCFFNELVGFVSPFLLKFSVQHSESASRHLGFAFGTQRRPSEGELLRNLSWCCWNCFHVVLLDCDPCIGRRTALLKECRTKSGDKLRNWRGRQELLAARLLWTGFLLNLILPGKLVAHDWFFLYALKLLACGFG